MKRLLAIALLLAPLGCHVEVKDKPDLDVKTDHDVDVKTNKVDVDVKRRGDGAPNVDVDVNK